MPHPRIPAIIAVLASLVPLARGEEPAPPASPAGLAVQCVTLEGGKQLVGLYDRAAGKLTLVNEKTGKPIGEIAIDPGKVRSVEQRQLAVAGPPAPGDAGGPGANGSWITDYEKAKALAIAADRPLLIDFTGSDWCGWCKKLDAEVFARKEFREWAQARVVLLKLDFPHGVKLPAALQKQNQELAAKYQVRGYPTIHVVDARTGASLRKWGYFEGGPAAWIDAMVGGVPGLEKLQRR